MQKNKFIIYCSLLGILTGLVLGGCGKAEENISEPLTEPEANSTAPDFSVPLQLGRIYEIYMEWNEDKLAENGFSGIAYYGVKTGGEEAAAGNGLTEKANDILISIDDSYSMTVHNAETGEVDVIEEVAMEVAYASPKGIHLVFTNHTNEEYMFGDDYELQAWQGMEKGRLSH